MSFFLFLCKYLVFGIFASIFYIEKALKEEEEEKIIRMSNIISLRKMF